MLVKTIQNFMFLFIVVRGSKWYSVCVCMYLFLYVCACVCVSVCVCVCVCVCVGQKTTFESQFSPIMWVPKTKLRLSTLSVNAFTCGVILKSSNEMRTKFIFHFNVLAIKQIKPDLYMLGKLFTSEL